MPRNTKEWHLNMELNHWGSCIVDRYTSEGDQQPNQKLSAFSEPGSQASHVHMNEINRSKIDAV